MKVMFIVNALGYSGVGKMISYLANSVSEAGYEVVMYVLENEGQYYNLELFQNNLFETSIELKKGKHIAKRIGII